FNRFTQLPEIFGLVRIAEIQAVRDSQWICTGTGKVSRRFGDGDLPAFAWVERAIHRIAIRGRRQNFVGVANEKNGGVRTGFHDRAGANGVIVLPINPILGRAMMSIRSCDSLSRTSYGVMPDSRLGTLARSISMPLPARLAVSQVEQVRPAAPMS